ncbi:MAG: peroxiredoxin [Flavobacteriales bacterium]
MGKMRAVGDFAPDFVLKNQHGQVIKFSEFRASQNVVLYFYPKDDTPGCTAEAKCFRDSFESFLELGALVVGISSDSPEAHMKFAEKYRLPFTLLSDTAGRVRKMYGVPSTLMFLPGRTTFIIDSKGIIRHVFSSQFNINKHIEESIRILKSIGSGSESNP